MELSFEAYPRLAQPIEITTERSYVPSVSLVLAVATIPSILIAFELTKSYSLHGPPTFGVAHRITELVIVAALLCGFAGSRGRISLANRLVASLATLIALGASLVYAGNYQSHFESYPSEQMAVVGAIAVVGGLLCKQKLIAIAVIAYMLYQSSGYILHHGNFYIGTG